MWIDDLPPAVRRSVLHHYEGSAAGRAAFGLRNAAAAFGLRNAAADHVRNRWCEVVKDIDVELHPGGRAVLRRKGADYSVEVNWRVQATARGGDIRIPRVTVIEDPGKNIGIDQDMGGAPDVEQYLAALSVHTRSGGTLKGPIPTDRPQAGKPLNTTFYRQVLANYDALVREGRRDPAKELAQRMGVKHGTMKTWLRRARDYGLGAD